MTDGTALPNRHQPAQTNAGNTKSDTTADAKNGVVEDQGDPRQAIFDERFATLTDGFGQACEQNNVKLAIAIAMHPDETQPMVFIKGHQFDVAALMARILKILKEDLYSALE